MTKRTRDETIPMPVFDDPSADIQDYFDENTTLLKNEVVELLFKLTSFTITRENMEIYENLKGNQLACLYGEVLSRKVYWMDLFDFDVPQQWCDSVEICTKFVYCKPSILKAYPDNIIEKAIALVPDEIVYDARTDIHLDHMRKRLGDRKYYQRYARGVVKYNNIDDIDRLQYNGQLYCDNKHAIPIKLKQNRFAALTTGYGEEVDFDTDLLFDYPEAWIYLSSSIKYQTESIAKAFWGKSVFKQTDSGIWILKETMPCDLKHLHDFSHRRTYVIFLAIKMNPLLLYGIESWMGHFVDRDSLIYETKGRGLFYEPSVNDYLVLKGVELLDLSEFEFDQDGIDWTLKKYSWIFPHALRFLCTDTKIKLANLFEKKISKYKVLWRDKHILRDVFFNFE